MRTVTIFEIEHGCGFGPYRSELHDTFTGAVRAFERLAKELRKKEEYVKASWRKNGRLYEECMKRIDHFQTEHESNTESGFECWTNDEYLAIREVQLHCAK